MSLGLFMASVIESLVISWNSNLLVFCTFKPSTCAKCQAIDSPSLSGSVAKITSSASRAAALNLPTTPSLSLLIIYVGAKPLSTSTPSPPLPFVARSRMCPKEASTR